MNNNILGVIPSRFASTRLHGKPLKDIHGYPMVWHVYQQAAKAGLAQLIVATDDRKVMQACSSYDIPCEMTSPTHGSGTDRVAEIATRYPQYSHIINIQGDEPLISPDLIKKVAHALCKRNVDMASARHRISDTAAQDPNIVKVVTDTFANALYFSRSPIPYKRAGQATYWQHIGIYGYTRESLLQMSILQKSPLEIAESLEQLRALANGMTIRMVKATEITVGVDTMQDLEYVRTLF